MLTDEFRTIAQAAVGQHPGHVDVVVTGVTPTRHGPLVEWRGGSPLPRQDDGRTLSPPAAQDVLGVLARVLALRWQTGRAVIPADWDVDLDRRFPDTFEPGGPCSGGGWRWLWEAGATLVQDAGATGFRTTQTKEKFAQARWYYSIEGKTRRSVRNEVSTVVDCIEQLSAYICETCGAPGRIRYGGWAKTSCVLHADGKA